MKRRGGETEGEKKKRGAREGASIAGRGSRMQPRWRRASTVEPAYPRGNRGVAPLWGTRWPGMMFERIWISGNEASCPRGVSAACEPSHRRERGETLGKEYRIAWTKRDGKRKMREGVSTKRIKRGRVKREREREKVKRTRKTNKGQEEEALRQSKGVEETGAIWIILCI